MLSFFGTPVMHPAHDNETMTTNMANLLNIDPVRIAQLAELLQQTQQEANSVKTQYGTAFDFNMYLNKLDLDLESPGELVFVGMCIGRHYQEAVQAGEKVMEEVFKNPENMMKLLFEAMFNKKP